MLKRLELHDVSELHSYVIEPTVYPYVRYKAETLDEYFFVIKKVMEKEENEELVIRTILNELGKPIGQIGLFDIEGNTGFLGTWIGMPFQGKGYNQIAKERFFDELFFQRDIESVFMKIREGNEKSKRAARKLPYVEQANLTKPDVFQKINQGEFRYDLFEIRKEKYMEFMEEFLEA